MRCEEAERMTAIRIGAVSYLNTRPLIHGLRSNTEYTLSLDTPGVLSEKLRLGEIDVGLIPTVEYLRGIGDAVLPVSCIATEGAVQTVKLYSRVSPARLQNVAVDSGSRTSVALLRLLLAERFGVTPDFHTFRPDLREMLRVHEAALLIGDAAFTDSGAPHIWDLGQGWQELTNLPFVFAVWSVGHGVDAERVAGWLRGALHDGMNHLDEIARDGAARLGHEESMLRHYLGSVLHFSLGEREMRGIETFQRLCVQYNIVKNARKLEILGALEGMEVPTTSRSSGL
jgi:chorismate dehydratase